jgi:hypothetical protein
MSGYNFTQDLSTMNFEVKVDPVEHYGYFEHNRLGDEIGGGLWFSPEKELVDYDGVYELPREVWVALQDAGYWGEKI